MTAIIEGIGVILLAWIMIYAVVKFIENCSGDDNAD